MVEYLEGVESKPHLFVLLLGDGMPCSQAFAVILGKAIETETVLALDTCFKAYYVFDTNYRTSASRRGNFSSGWYLILSERLQLQ